MSDLHPDLPSAELARALTKAAANRQAYHNLLLTPAVLLRTFLDDSKSVAFQLLGRLQEQRDLNFDGLKERAEMMAHHDAGKDANFYFTDDTGQDVPLDTYAIVLFDEARTLAKSRNEKKVSSGHILAAMARPGANTFGLLQRYGIHEAAVIALLDEVVVSEAGLPPFRDFVEEALQGKAPGLFVRSDPLRELTTLLSLAGSRHLILVGPEGCGKRTLAYSLAQLIAEKKNIPHFQSLVQMNEAVLLEQPKQVLTLALRRAQAGILLLPQIDRFFSSGRRPVFSETVNTIVQKALLANQTTVIGTTTPDNDAHLQQIDIIRQNCNRLELPPATVKESIAILQTHQERLHQEYELDILDAGITTAVQLANQYIQTDVLPLAALRLLDRACGLVRLVTASNEVVYPGMAPDGQVDAADVMQAAAQMTKIPITKLNEDEKGKYAQMVDHLHRRIIGQDEAVQAVSRAVKTARVGLRDKKRPIGSFLFLGPSGVGKTELAKALAEFMFGTEKAMLTLDMSEYQEQASVNKLIGAPPGYVGFQDGGRLTNFVRERPYTVILFDEVEKAHTRVFDILLQVLEEGRLTDSHGRTASFSEAVIIMTSNLGSQHLLVPALGEAEREAVMAVVHHFFRPEFLNRIDEIILFHQLYAEQLAQILDLMLAQELRLAREQRLEIDISDGAKTWLLSQNTEPEYGARPLRRLITRHLREPLADFLLSQQFEGETAIISVGAGEGKLEFIQTNRENLSDEKWS